MITPLALRLYHFSFSTLAFLLVLTLFLFILCYWLETLKDIHNLILHFLEFIGFFNGLIETQLEFLDSFFIFIALFNEHRATEIEGLDIFMALVTIACTGDGRGDQSQDGYVVVGGGR